MAIRSMNRFNPLVRQVRRAALLCAPTVLSDGRLLESFLTCRDEAAFAMLVKRHGPMVLGVCRRVIGNLHDAEDAFQAVFLVLARKANSVVPRDLVGNWLHGVAYRTALQARSRLERHRARERQVQEMPQPTVAPDLDLHELHHVLDEELNGLPEKFRVAIVLCDLEGGSRHTVACQLKIPEGTLSSRLAKGRRLLAERLARHGLMLSGAGLATALADQTALAAIQPALVVSTVQAAALTAAGQSAAGLVSTTALSLSQGVLKTMFLNKLKVISFVVLGMVLGGLGAGFIGLPGYPTAVRAAPPGAFVQAAEPQPAKDQEPLDGNLLLQQSVQKELRLSKTQIDRLQAISQEVDARSAPQQKEVQQIQKQIEELQQRIATLQQNIGTLQQGVEKQRTQSLGKAAPEILSARAVQRLREIGRQQRSLDTLLEDRTMQRMLKVDDEQLKKIETIRKTEPIWEGVAWGYHQLDNRIPWNTKLENIATARVFEYNRFPETSGVWQALVTTDGSSSVTNEKTLRKLFAVLTSAQQRALLDWVGEPYHESWRILKGKE